VATFIQTTAPTPFGFFDSDATFQAEADAMVTFVKRKLGDDILSVELTKKQIWACFEEATLEYGSIVNQYQAKSQLLNLLGIQTGSLSGAEQKLPRENLEYVMRQAEAYSMEASLGGSYTAISGSIQLERMRQDYNIYDELKDESGNLIFSSSLNNPKSKMKIMEVFHFSPQAAYRFFDTTSAINYLNNEFAFESFTPETVFYILPTFEDVLRGGMLNISQRIRRSHYSYKIVGTNLRLFPTPTQDDPKKIWIRVQFRQNPLAAPFDDKSIDGVNNLSNVPYGNLQYEKLNSIGRQWIRQFCLALAKELLGLIRSKFSTVPIPGADLTLNGTDLVSQGREEQTEMITQLKEMLDSMTYNKLLEVKAAEVDNLQKILRNIPIPNGRAIIVG
jgi:hypothetical protein